MPRAPADPRPEARGGPPRPALSVCVLLFGDHTKLARRCLGSILPTLDEGRPRIAEFRLGLNDAAPATREYAVAWASEVDRRFGLPSILYEPERNVCKYPLMRAMFRDAGAPLAEYVMWFDDDSYPTGQPGWWDRVISAAGACDMIGQCRWAIPVVGVARQWCGRAGKVENCQVGVYLGCVSRKELDVIPQTSRQQKTPKRNPGSSRGSVGRLSSIICDNRRSRVKGAFRPASPGPLRLRLSPLLLPSRVLFAGFPNGKPAQNPMKIEV